MHEKYEIQKNEDGTFYYTYEVEGMSLGRRIIKGPKPFVGIYIISDEPYTVVVRDTEDKYNVIRNGGLQFEDDGRADVFYYANDKFYLADLDQQGKVSRKNLVEVSENGEMQYSSRLDISTNPESYGHGLHDAFFVDNEGNVFDGKYFEKIKELYNQPSAFLTLETEYFKDKTFVNAATVAVKNGIKKDMEGKEDISVEYVEYVQTLVSDVKNKTEQEFKNIEEMAKAVAAKKAERAGRVSAIDNILGDL